MAKDNEVILLSHILVTLGSFGLGWTLADWTKTAWKAEAKAKRKG